MNRQSLINYIKKNIPFYQFVDFNGHSIEELKSLQSKIEAGVHQRQNDKNNRSSLQNEAKQKVNRF
jgi:hypothetical protein